MIVLSLSKKKGKSSLYVNGLECVASDPSELICGILIRDRKPVWSIHEQIS